MARVYAWRGQDHGHEEFRGRFSQLSKLPARSGAFRSRSLDTVASFPNGGRRAIDRSVGAAVSSAAARPLRFCRRHAATAGHPATPALEKQVSGQAFDAIVATHPGLQNSPSHLAPRGCLRQGLGCVEVQLWYNAWGQSQVRGSAQRGNSWKGDRIERLIAISKAVVALARRHPDG